MLSGIHGPFKMNDTSIINPVYEYAFVGVYLCESVYVRKYIQQ